MYFPQSATFYLHDPTTWANPSINIGTAYDPNGLVTVEPNGLLRALEGLVNLARSTGRRPHLEVHCHGLPAELLLGKLGAVTNSNVAWVGRRLAQALRSGGLIELLACRVASQHDASGGWHNLLIAEQHLIQGYEPDYHDPLRLRRKLLYRRYNVDPDLKTSATLGNTASWSTTQQIYGRGAIPRQQAIPTTKGAKFVPLPEKDGLVFCRTLAAESQCIVRAAVTLQIEEDPGSSPIGEWENEVFDFHPGGKVEFKGSSPYRGPLMDSYEPDRHFA